MRQSSKLHAKIILSNGPVALAGSANLTAGGYLHNFEVVSKVRDAELTSLRVFAKQLRERLQPVRIARFERFVTECLAKKDERKEFLDLIRKQATPVLPGAGSLIPYQPDFENYIRGYPSSMALRLSVIADNRDGNNNQGKVKHAFFGIQRFLQEYPQHLATVAALPDDELVDVRGQPFEADWRKFLKDYAGEVNLAYGYRIRTLYLTYLTEQQGGKLTGGGGGDNELQRAWPLVGRLIAQHPAGA